MKLHCYSDVKFLVLDTDNRILVRVRGTHVLVTLVQSEQRVMRCDGRLQRLQDDDEAQSLVGPPRAAVWWRVDDAQP